MALMNVKVAKQSSEKNGNVSIDKSLFIASLKRVERFHIYCFINSEV